MMNRVDLGLFKCFQVLRLPLAPLTLLAGANGSGKSSVLQALVLLNQTMREHEWSTRLMLNGATIKLGTVSDVVDKLHGRRTLSIGIHDGPTRCEWSFSGERSEMSMSVDRVSLDGSEINNPAALRFLIPTEFGDRANELTDRVRGLTYITAERIGPREVYVLDDRQTASVVGPAGEHAVSVLHWGREERVLEELILQDAPPTRLRQVEARMQSFFPGCGLTVDQVPRVNAVTLGLRTSPGTDFHRPTHVGFGLTQILPIVVAGLSVERGSLLLIENPEVHLHPAGQAAIGRFLTQLASAGIQVVAETHSDHVLNGVRRSVKEELIDATDVAVHFFRARPSEGPEVTSPTLDQSGGLDTWPDGFFDQIDKDLGFLAGWD